MRAFEPLVLTGSGLFLFKEVQDNERHSFSISLYYMGISSSAVRFDVVLGKDDTMTALITFISILLGLGTSAGSFYWGYRVGIINKTADDNKVFLQNALDQIKQMDEVITQLEYQLEQQQREKRNTVVHIQRGWDPADPLNSAGRR